MPLLAPLPASLRMERGRPAEVFAVLSSSAESVTQPAVGAVDESDQA